MKLKNIRNFLRERKRKKRFRFIQETNLYIAELEIDVLRLKDSLFNVMRENEHDKEIIRQYKERYEPIQSQAD